jgi:hypothetical protein
MVANHQGGEHQTDEPSALPSMKYPLYGCIIISSV